MTDVQLKHGYTRIADALYEALIRSPMPGRHKDTVHAIIRLTYGYQKKADRIGSEQLGDLLGVKASGVRRMLRDLEGWGVITRQGGGTGRGDCPMVGVVKDFDSWSVGRSETSKEQGGRRRTASIKRNVQEESGTCSDVKRNVKGDKGGPTRITPKRTKENTENYRAKKTCPPSELTESDRARLSEWAAKKQPWALPRLAEFEEACLEHHTKEGNLSADWNLNVHQWIRNHKQWHGTGTGTNGGTHGPKPGTLDAACADQLERIDREERENAARDEATSQLSLSSGRES